MLPDDELARVFAEFLQALADGMNSRRRQNWSAARERFAEANRLARQLSAEEFADLAAAHIALIDADRESAEFLLSRVAAALPGDDDTAALAMLIAERWPAPARECETHLCASAKRFRELCATLPGGDETALELGAAHGLATRVLAQHCAQVYAIEKSPAMAVKARAAVAGRANVKVIVASADDLGLVRAHAPRADVVCLDIGGSTPFAKVMHRAREYRELYQPRVLLVRSVYLNNFVAGLASCEPTYGPSLWAKPKPK